MNHSKLKSLMLCSLAALFVSGQAFAHTGVRDKVAEEGTSSYNGFTITHGCGAHTGADPWPVLGQAAVFPFGENAVWRNAAGAVIARGGDGGGTVSITQPDDPSLPRNPFTLSVAGYAGFSSPFTTTQEIVDDLGNVQALLWKDGAMEPKLNAVTPFKISAPKIANNCVKSLKIRIGVINYCDLEKNAANDAAGPYKEPKDAFGRKIPMLADLAGTGGVQRNVAGAAYYKTLRAGNDDNNRADWWFFNLDGGSSKYIDPDLFEEGVKLWSAVLTVNNTDANAAGCPGGALTEVSVEPNGVAFDTYLSGPNTRPFTKGDSDL